MARIVAAQSKSDPIATEQCIARLHRSTLAADVLIRVRFVELQGPCRRAERERSVCCHFHSVAALKLQCDSTWVRSRCNDDVVLEVLLRAVECNVDARINRRIDHTRE